MRILILCAMILVGVVSTRCKASGEIPDSATLVAKACNGCTLTQATSLAASLGQGDHYIYDLPDNHFYLFEVECEPIVGGKTCYASALTPAPARIASFNNYHLAWTQNNYNEAFVYTINYNVPSGQPAGQHDDGYVNAYDTIYTGAYQVALVDWLDNPSNYSGTLALIVSVLNNATSYFSNVVITVTVVFHDGSKRKFDFVLNNSQFEPIANSGTDADANPLPEQRPGGPRGYVFNDGPTGHHYGPGNIAVLLGVAPPDLNETYYSCDWDGQENLTCQYIH
jgi:hypothetical protein